jgi:hypothetical protein
LSSWAIAKDIKWDINKSNTQDSSSQAPQNDDITQTSNSEPERRENPSNITPMDFSLQSKWQTDIQKPPVQESEVKDNEDLKNRADIFRTF